jgi:hypothetical protein
MGTSVSLVAFVLETLAEVAAAEIREDRHDVERNLMGVVTALGSDSGTDVDELWRELEQRMHELAPAQPQPRVAAGEN